MSASFLSPAQVLGAVPKISLFAANFSTTSILRDTCDHDFQRRTCDGVAELRWVDQGLRANQIKAAFEEAVLGVKDRLVLSDAAWARMAPLI